MYLKKLNHKWSAFLEANGIADAILITNTTKLNLNAGMYMLEFEYKERRYQLYHVLGSTDYDLLVLDEGYENTTFEAVFGLSEPMPKPCIGLVNCFMVQNVEGIQTSVDCSEGGLDQAKLRIKQVRLRP